MTATTPMPLPQVAGAYAGKQLNTLPAADLLLLQKILLRAAADAPDDASRTAILSWYDLASKSLAIVRSIPAAVAAPRPVPPRMRLTHVDFDGLRGRTVSGPIAPVMLFVGPNGSGKTTAIGAVLYALTGRYPGVQGADAGKLLPLASSPDRGFGVVLRAESATAELLIERSLRGRGEDAKHALRVTKTDRGDGERGQRSASRIREAERLLQSAVGEAGFWADAFDPVKSFWKKSIEERTVWAFGLCAAESGWDRERLIAELGPQNDDWDPFAADDVATILAVHLARLQERKLAAQKVAREAHTVAEGLPTLDAKPTEQELLASREARDKAYAELASARHTAAQRGRELRVLEDSRRHAQAKHTQLLEKSRLAVLAMQAPLTVDDENVLRQRATEAEVAHEAAASEMLQLQAAVQHASGLLAIAARTGGCPTCRQDVSEERVDALRALGPSSLDGPLAGARQRHDATRARLAEAKARVAAVERSRAATAEVAALRREIGIEEGHLAKLGEMAKAIPPEPGPTTELEARHQEALVADNKLVAAAQLHAERDEQLIAQKKAEARATQLAAKIRHARAVRDRVLVDGSKPLAEALASLRALAPGAGFVIEATEHGIDIGYAMSLPSRFIPASMMSAGEQYRATIALLIATAMVRRPPWVGLFLDDFQLISKDVQRDVLVELVAHQRAGRVDNVFVLGSFEPPSDVDGIVVQRRTRAAVDGSGASQGEAVGGY